MLAYILRRLFIAIGTVWVISVVSFAMIQLPPGDYVTSYIAQLMSTGSLVTPRKKRRTSAPSMGWISPCMCSICQVDGRCYREFWRLHGVEAASDRGHGDRLLLTALLAFTAVIFTWILAIPIGIYSAVRQYSVGDYVVTCMGFIGLAVPNFLLALVIMYLAFAYFGASIGGLFSTEYMDAPWSWARVQDLLKHLWIPAIILSTAGTAQLIRILRANLLDELRKPYVVTARAKGLSELRAILKYPVRVALNPFISTVGYTLPYLVSGSIIVSMC